MRKHTPLIYSYANARNDSTQMLRRGADTDQG